MSCDCFRARRQTSNDVKIETTAILGAGGWGTALAALWARDGRDVVMWGHDPAKVARLETTRFNQDYLPGVPLPENVRLTSELKDCAGADLVVFVVPSKAFREIATAFAGFAKIPRCVFLSCTKGIEHKTGMRMSQILAEVFPSNLSAVL